jgi:Protein of unknown function (DUF3050)
VPSLSTAQHRLLAAEVEALGRHPIYDALSSLPRLRLFMAHHVYAVWDFMSLLKALGRAVAPVSLPWRPSRFGARAVRFVHQVTLDEESDFGPDGQPTSHFELYLRAMDEAGASTGALRAFLADGDLGRLPPSVAPFVAHTLELAHSGSPAALAGAFLYGRERLVPVLFERVLAGDRVRYPQLALFRFYLERHVALDGDEHGPASAALLDAVCDAQAGGAEEAFQAASAALAARRALWDAVLPCIEAAEG